MIRQNQFANILLHAQRSARSAGLIMEFATHRYVPAPVVTTSERKVCAMKFLPSLKLVLTIGTLEILLCLYEMAHIINCESAHADCSYFLMAIYANLPISLAVGAAEMVVFDQMHISASQGAQHAISAFLFIVFGTLWWSVLITSVRSALSKRLSRGMP